MAFILGFDTAMGGCSVAVLNTETHAVVSRLQPMARGQSEHLIPMVDDVVRQAGTGFDRLSLVACTIGPGAFTGVRIGLSAARGFGMALGIPVAGVTTVDVFAHQFFNDHKGKETDLLVILETKRADLYCQYFTADGHAVTDPALSTIDALAERFGGKACAVCGDALGRVWGALDGRWPAGWTAAHGYDLPDPETLVRLAAARHGAGESCPAEPLYLRGADVTLSTRPGRIIMGMQE